jgi:hypothetical protein
VSGGRIGAALAAPITRPAPSRRGAARAAVGNEGNS